MFPWQSGLDGTEQSQELHLNPISGEWKEDHSRLQRHVSLAIAYNVWQYWHNVRDRSFMEQYGLELILEIAHFGRVLLLWILSQAVTQSKVSWDRMNFMKAIPTVKRWVEK